MKTILGLFVASLCFGQISFHQLRITPLSSTSPTVGEVDFTSANNGNYVGLAAPDTLTGSTLFRLPSADGSPGQAVCTDGSKNWGWCSITGGSLTAPATITGSTTSPILSLTQSGTGAGLAINNGGGSVFSVSNSGALTGTHIQNLGLNDAASLYQVDAGSASGTQPNAISGTTGNSANYGVYGYNAYSGSTAGGGAGVYGQSNGGDYGVLGISSSGTGVGGTGTYGVSGTTYSLSGYGGWFANNGGGYGLYVNAGNVGGTHLQNLGTGDTPTFNGCVGCASNDISVSATNPLYVYAHFRDDDQYHLYVSWSRDGIHFADVAALGVYGHVTSGTPNSNRDPSVTYYNGTWYILASPDCGCAKVQLFSTTDFINWTYQTLDLATTITSVSGPGGSGVSPGGAAAAAWAPEWDLHGPNPGFWVAISSDSGIFGDTGGFSAYFVQMNMSGGSSSVASATYVALTGTSTLHRTFDFFPWYDGTNWYLLYADQQSGGTVSQPIAYAKASTQLGSYAQQTTPGADYFGWGNSFQTEGPAVFAIPAGSAGCPSGGVEIMVDEWAGVNQGATWARHYWQGYQYSCPGGGNAVFSAASLSGSPQQIAATDAEHGTVYVATTNALANTVYNAAAHYASDGVRGGRLGINTATPWYTVTVKSLKPASGSILDTEPAAIAIDPGDQSYAVLFGCGNAADTCWNAQPGSGRFAQAYDGAGSFGMFQLVNMNGAGNGEASLMFCDGCTQVGSAPASSLGGSSIWTVGLNNQWDYAGSNNQKFFISYGSAGSYPAIPFSISPSTGQVNISYGISLTDRNVGTHGGAASANIDADGSFGSTARVNIGTGAIGNSEATVVTGAIDLDKYIGRRSGSNRDWMGQLTLNSSGTASYTWQNPSIMQYAECIWQDYQHQSAQLTVSNSGTVLTFAGGSNGDVVTYFCSGAQF